MTCLHLIDIQNERSVPQKSKTYAFGFIARRIRHGKNKYESMKIIYVSNVLWQYRLEIIFR